jgi:hypothetical protein
MNLKSLSIERNYHSFDWKGAKPGEHHGEIVFDTPTSEVKFKLSEEHCAKIFAVVADAIIEVAKCAATSLMIEAQVKQARLVGGAA